MADWFSPFYYRSPDELPTPLNIPMVFRQNETPSWNDDEYEDVNGNIYSSADYTLTYVLAGPSTAPVELVGVPSNSGTAGWTTSISAEQSALCLPGHYWWQGILTASGVRIVAGEGQLKVEVDLGSLSGVYDGRTVWQKILQQCEAAMLSFVQSNGLIKSYMIGGRRMEFQDASQITELMDLARVRVAAEISKQYKGADRKLLARWSRAH
jgi:hypothetical protein